MRIGTIEISGQERVALVGSDNTVFLADDLLGYSTGSLLELLGKAQDVHRLETLSQTLSAGIPSDSVVWQAPIPNPRRNLICVGWNYMPHYEEGHRLRDYAVPEIPAHPALFSKMPETVVGPGELVRHSSPHSLEMDWEGELAVVIGSPGIDIAEEEALRHVFGYTIANDISVRDFQKRHGNQWFKGKSFDTHCPMGPYVVTVADLPDPQDLELSLQVNGEERQRASTSTMIFSVARLISEISIGMQLLPGDIILTGTPAGVGATLDPPQYLNVGDQVDVTISGIATLASGIVQAS